ncbi:DUF4142 domain-containing protein [uncultured Ramlibacter sp.]|uniref:DUF4142 domain-containing protein n=1 Tax=uncultured Ramlibacter sp. TaxID=260755 RepID=UPI00262FF3EC|nr:DUF4142 domain-containing protein [uncultured Ramlibacter sp.]
MLFAIALSGAALAETEAEYGRTPVAPAVPVEPVERPRPVRPVFAADAVRGLAPTSPEMREERAFLKTAAAAARFEAEAGKLALGRSTDPRVLAFAADLMDRHSATSLELTQLLHVRGMAPPMLDNGQRALLKSLAKRSGSKFDREFMDQVGLKSLREDLRLYDKASLAAQDPSLKAWLERQLPQLRSSVLMAERVAPGGSRLAQERKSGAALPTTLAPRQPPLAGVTLATQKMGGGAAAPLSVSSNR